MTKACRNIFIFPLLLGVLIPAATLIAADDFDHPNSYIGNADWDHGLLLWVEVAKIPIGDGTFLPLRLRFTSKEKSAQSDKNWWCPLMESHALLPKNYFIEYSTLGGDGGYLVRANQFVSDDGRTKATLDGNAIEMDSGGWVYHYQEGKITDARAPDGTRLEWKYDGASIRLKVVGGECLAEMTRSGGDLRILLPTLKTEFSLKQKLDRNGDLTGWSLAFPNGRKDDMKLERSANGETKLSVFSSDGTRGIYRWKTETGDLLSDSDFTYEIRPTDLGRDLLNRVDALGLTEWYYYDADKGAATYKRQDGSRVVSWYDLGRGPTNMKVFRMDTMSVDQKLVSSRLLTYTPDGVPDRPSKSLASMRFFILRTLFAWSMTASFNSRSNPFICGVVSPVCWLPTSDAS